jgi:type IV pilus assembly protein PilV
MTTTKQLPPVTPRIMSLAYFPQKNQGSSFIEILVSLFIIVSGILGSIGMQALAIKGSIDAKQRTLATSYIQDIIGRMRVNHPNALINYQKTINDTHLVETPDKLCNSLTDVCSVEDIAKKDLYEWQSSLLGLNSAGTRQALTGLLQPTACISVSKSPPLNKLENTQGEDDIANTSINYQGSTGVLYQVSVSIAWQSKTQPQLKPTNNCDSPVAGTHYIKAQTYIL